MQMTEKHLGPQKEQKKIPDEEFLRGAGSVAGGAMLGAAVGGPVGAVVGATAGFILGREVNRAERNKKDK